MTQPTKQAKQPPKGQAAPQPRSFLVGTQEVIEGQDYDKTVNTYGARSVIQNPVPILGRSPAR